MIFWFQPEPIISKMLFYGLKNIFGEKLPRVLPKIPHTDVFKIMYEKILNDSSGRWMCSASSMGVQVSFLGVSSFSFKKFQEVSRSLNGGQFQEVSRSVKKWTIPFLCF